MRPLRGTSPSPEDAARPHWCLFMWRARWSEREKQRPQWWHLKGFAPVCLRKCRVSSSDLANRHSQPSQEHRYGFSPETQSGVRNLAEERERREEMPSQGGCLEKLNIKKRRVRWRDWWKKMHYMVVDVEREK